jgi:hypothetical protein
MVDGAVYKGGLSSKLLLFLLIASKKGRLPGTLSGSVSGAGLYLGYESSECFSFYFNYETPLFLPVCLEATRNQIIAGISTSETIPPPIERAG